METPIKGSIKRNLSYSKFSCTLQRASGQKTGIYLPCVSANAIF